MTMTTICVLGTYLLWDKYDAPFCITLPPAFIYTQTRNRANGRFRLSGISDSVLLRIFSSSSTVNTVQQMDSVALFSPTAQVARRSVTINNSCRLSSSISSLVCGDEWGKWRDRKADKPRSEIVYSYNHKHCPQDVYILCHLRFKTCTGW